MTRLALALSALALVAACSAQAPSASAIRASMTQAQLAQLSTPLMLAEVPDSGLAATLVPVQSRGGVETWRTGDAQTLTFREGVLIATRGLGDDLMSADVNGTLAALRRGGGTDYPRLMSYLDGEDRNEFRAMTCNMSAPQSATVEGIGTRYPTRLSVETCYTTGLSVTNRYWHDVNGKMRRAEQWAGPGLGMLVTERLTR